MESNSSKTFYCSNTCSLLYYPVPTWFFMLGDLKILGIPLLCDFLMDLFNRHISKIAKDVSHLLHSHITFNNSRRSSQKHAITNRNDSELKSVLIPYFLFSCLYMIINDLFKQISIYMAFTHIFEFILFSFVNIQYYHIT